MFRILLSLIQSPIRLLFVSWGFVALCYCLSPFQFNEPWSIKTICFVFSFFVLFSVSYLLGKEFAVSCGVGKYKQNIVSLMPSSNQHFVSEETNFRLDRESNFRLNQFILLIALLGFLGSLLLAIDLLFLRGIDYGQGVSAARDLMNLKSLERGGLPAGRGLSIVGRILSGFLPVATLIVILRLRKIFTSTLFLLFVLILLQCLCEALTGGRNSIFIILVLFSMGVLVNMNTPNEKFRKAPKVLLKLKSFAPWLGAFFFVYVIYIFVERESLRDRTLVESYENMQNAFLLNFDFSLDTFTNISEHSLSSSLSLAMIYLLVYVVHGLNELNLLCSQIIEPNFWYGLYNLFLPALLLQKLGLISPGLLEQIPISLERSGLYLTALGAIYIDFGYYFSLALFASFGLLTGFVWKAMKISKGRLSYQLICSYLLLTIAISPFYLSISTANGFQILSALILTCVILRLKGLNTV